MLSCYRATVYYNYKNYTTTYYLLVLTTYYLLYFYRTTYVVLELLIIDHWSLILKRNFLKRKANLNVIKKVWFIIFNAILLCCTVLPVLSAATLSAAVFCCCVLLCCVLLCCVLLLCAASLSAALFWRSDCARCLAVLCALFLFFLFPIFSQKSTKGAFHGGPSLLPWNTIFYSIYTC